LRNLPFELSVKQVQAFIAISLTERHKTHRLNLQFAGTGNFHTRTGVFTGENRISQVNGFLILDLVPLIIASDLQANVTVHLDQLSDRWRDHVAMKIRSREIINQRSG